MTCELLKVEGFICVGDKRLPDVSNLSSTDLTAKFKPEKDGQ